MSDVQKLIAQARSWAEAAQGTRTDSDPLGMTAQLLLHLADALESATSPVEPEGDVVERLARHLANLDNGDAWPGNSELGGSLTGTRDDEYRAAMQEEAREILELIGFSRPVGGETEYRAILGPVSGEERVTIPGAVSSYMEALDEYPLEFEERGQHPIILARQVTAWSLVSPEQDGGKR